MVHFEGWRTKFNTFCYKVLKMAAGIRAHIHFVGGVVLGEDLGDMWGGGDNLPPIQ